MCMIQTLWFTKKKITQITVHDSNMVIHKKKNVQINMHDLNMAMNKESFYTN
jgi:hypothetical protein